MKIGVWNYYEDLNVNNFLFLNKDVGIGDNLLLPFNKLYLNGKKNGIEFMTLDTIENFEDIDGLLFFDFPRPNNYYVERVFKLKIPKYLVIFESEIIKPDNWCLENHKLFDKIFTWNDEFIDNNKYFKLNFSHLLPKEIDKNLSKKKKLCTLISSHHKNNHPLELYSKREEAIRWFEKNHPVDFDLYGQGWNFYIFKNRYVRYLLGKIKLDKLFKSNFPSYKGSIGSKKYILEKYKFSICYENAQNISGYITEKIFDCFLAGCVPIYLGADNITDHVPANCFVDKRKFNNYEDLYQYINTISDDEYAQYLNNIELFFNSKGSEQFTSQYFAKTIVSNMQTGNKVDGAEL